MRTVFLSNYLNHHQLPFCLEMVKLSGDDFTFIATCPAGAERIKFGYTDLNSQYNFVLRSFDGEESFSKAKKLCTECDLLLFSSGNVPKELYSERVKKDKLTFRLSERFIKKPSDVSYLFLRKIKAYFESGRYKNMYLLCNSAFSSADFAKTGVFKNKAYKFGYFTEARSYDDIDLMIGNKAENSILWAGRFLNWKHADAALEVAKRLKADGYTFKMNMIGSGETEDELKAIVSRDGLEEYVTILGSMPPQKVREYMENSEIYLFTSDRREGWGAVLNEAMNSACAVVASYAIGSVPFMINDGVNGFIYKDGDVEDLYAKVKALFDDKQKMRTAAKNAYMSFSENWTPEIAAGRLLKLAEALDKREEPFPFENGVCSKAEILADDWYLQ